MLYINLLLLRFFTNNIFMSMYTIGISIVKM